MTVPRDENTQRVPSPKKTLSKLQFAGTVQMSTPEMPQVRPHAKTDAVASVLQMVGAPLQVKMDDADGEQPDSGDSRLSAFKVPDWLSELDPVALHLNRTNSACVAVDENGKCQVEKGVTVMAVSSIWTLMGSVVVVLAIALFACYAGDRFMNQEPSINEVSVESLSSEHLLPDIAFTLNIPDMEERELLHYMWPVFTWKELRDGMSNRSTDDESLEDVKFGSDCELQAGYGDNEDGAGSSSWPVFCLLGSSKKLRGRFGDPSWNYLNVKISQCQSTETNLSSALYNEWKQLSNSTCANMSQLDQLFEQHGGFGINIWFRFRSEDWSESGGLTPSKGMVSQEGKHGWTWFIYQVLSHTIDLRMTIDLRLNTAAGPLSYPKQL